MPRCLPASLPRGSGARQTTTVKPVSPAMSKLSSVRNAPYVLSWSALVFGLRSSCGWKFGVIRKGARDILLLTSPAPPSFPRAAADPPPHLTLTAASRPVVARDFDLQRNVLAGPGSRVVWVAGRGSPALRERAVLLRIESTLILVPKKPSLCFGLLPGVASIGCSRLPVRHAEIVRGSVVVGFSLYTLLLLQSARVRRTWAHARKKWRESGLVEEAFC